MKTHIIASLILFAGCATAPGSAEAAREIVLQYVAVDVGTAGPFTQKSKRELDILSDKDRIDAAGLLDHGAVAFLVYPKNQSSGPASLSTKQSGTRIILVQHGRVVGDFKAP